MRSSACVGRTSSVRSRCACGPRRRGAAAAAEFGGDKHLAHLFRRSVVHANGVDLQQFQPAPDRSPSDKNIQLLFVGQDFKRKGLAAVIDALGLVRDAGFTPSLRVIGRDDSTPYRNQAGRLGIADQVAFEGVSPNIQTAYQAADLFVFPTLYDPFANVCLEALACGLPVLTTTTNGSSEIVTEGEDGYVVDGSAGDLASRLAEKINGFCKLAADRRGEIRIHARNKAEHFTTRENAQTIVDLFLTKPEKP